MKDDLFSTYTIDTTLDMLEMKKFKSIQGKK